MALVNALLVQWVRGRVRVIDQPSINAWGRHADYLDVGAAQSEADAVRIAKAKLAVTAQPRVTTTLQLEPRYNGDVPGVDANLGDTVTTHAEAGGSVGLRLRALTTGDGKTGGVEWVPELADVQAEAAQLLGEWLRRMAPGALGGASRSASPSPGPLPPEAAPPKEVPPFSQAQVKVQESGRWQPPIAMRISRLVATLNTVGAGPTTVYVRKNGVDVAAAGGWGGVAAFRWEGVPGTQGLRVSIDLAPGDYLSMFVVLAGVGANGLVVQPTGV